MQAREFLHQVHGLLPVVEALASGDERGEGDDVGPDKLPLHFII